MNCYISCIHTNNILCLCAQEAQRAAKAANVGKHLTGKKLKEASAVKEEEKKLMLAKNQTTGLNVTKSDILVTGKFFLYNSTV